MEARARRSRSPAVAGLFYPEDPAELSAAVSRYLDEAAPPSGADAPKALIAPHAGFVYSGPVAGSAYAQLRGRASAISRVVLLGPSHRVALQGLAAPAVDAFATPLGEIPIDREAVERALALPQVRRDDGPHAREHSLEVQLPFLQQVLGRFSLAPFSVGDASAEDVAGVLELLWGGSETLVVVSSDLSHYHDYETARRLDAHTTRAIESLRPDALDSESACGRVPIRGLLTAASRRGLRVSTLDVRSSGDTAGGRDEVVGYGAWALA